MTVYPVKMLKDKDGTLFVPLTNTDSVQTTTGDSLETMISNKVDKETGKGLSTNDYTTTEKNKLAGIAVNAEVNQNAFSNVKVGSTTIAADGKTDTLELAAGSNITLTPDATNDKITIAASQPTVNNGQLTIQRNGTNVQTFTANQSGNATANITVPTKVSQLTNDSGYTSNTGTITKVQANGTDVASSGTANIPAASTSAYGVTKLSDATNSTSTALAATANAVKKAYDLANTANTGLTNKLDTHNGEVEASAEGFIDWNSGTLYASSYDSFENEAQFQLYKNQIDFFIHSEEDGDSKLKLRPDTAIDLMQYDADDIYSSGLSLKNNEIWLSTNDNDQEHSTYIQIKEADRSIKLYGENIKVSQAPTTDLGIANKKYVDDAISALPEPMIFKGSLGTGGTITSLPTAAATNEGHTYKVITAGTYASQAAKAGDVFICAKTGTNTYAWTLIPSGDEPSGTVTSVTLKATSPIAIDSSSAITTSGTRTLSHATSGVTAGTYRSVTVNDTGHVTAGTNPTTLSGYGITDAKITGSTITLGSKTITPSTATNWVNGSATGSVRTTSATAESSTYTMGDYAVAEGSSTSAIARASHAEGESNTVTISGLSGHAEGCLNTVSGNSGHAEGYNTVAEGNYSHSQNRFTQALGISSHAEGEGTMAFAQAEHVSGTYNVLEIGQSADEKSYAVVVGNGTNSGARSNAHTLDWSGNAWFSGDVYVGSTGGKNKDDGSKKLLTADDVTDTKNTAGSTDTSSKIFLIGATSQAAHPQTYSDNEVYATSGVLTTKSVQVGGTAATMQYNSTDKCIEFVFA